MSFRSFDAALLSTLLLLAACGSDAQTSPGGGTPDGSATGGSGGSTAGGSGGKSHADSGSGGVTAHDAASDVGGGGTPGTGGGAVEAGSGGSGAADSGSPGSGEDSGAGPDASARDGAIDAAPQDAGACVGTRLVDISFDAQGISATSADPDHTPSEVLDGDATTAWFGGASDATPVLTWTGTRDDCITEIKTTNTAAVPGVWAGWGYESVVVKVLDSSNLVVFAQTVPMTGSPDPNGDVTIPNGVVGRKVVLAFSGLEGTNTTGGVAELNVIARH